MTDVCQFLYHLINDEKFQQECEPLVKFLDSGRKKFAGEPLFHFLRGEMEMRRGPIRCDRRLARQCFEMAQNTAKPVVATGRTSIAREIPQAGLRL